MGKASRHKHERHARLGIPDFALDSLHADNPEHITISPSLVELIRPYTDDETSLDELRVLVSAGALAWNLARLPRAVREEELEQLLLEIDEETEELFVQLIEELTERKLQLFPDDPRIITGWDVKKKNGRHFVIAAALVEGPAQHSMH